MEIKRESFFLKLWKTIWPVFIYMVVQNIVAAAGMIVVMIMTALRDADGMVDMAKLTAGAEDGMMKYMLLFLLISALICIPIYAKMHENDCRKAKETKKNIPLTSRDICCIIVSSAALALGLNNLISMTPLPNIFTGHEEVNETLFGGGIVLEILAGGVFACIVEELCMRGVVYKRMRRYWGVRPAIFFSALVFGVYHLNVVQGVYAFLLGLFMAWLVERYDSLWASIICHMSANLFVIMLSESGIMEMISGNLVGYCLVTCTSMLVFFYGMRWLKQTNPLVELEFVKKEPDTLQGLTNEYKGQDGKEEEK